MGTLQSPSGNTIPFEPYIHVLLIPKQSKELIPRLGIHSIATINSNHIKQPSTKFKLQKQNRYRLCPQTILKKHLKTLLQIIFTGGVSMAHRKHF